MKTLSERLIGDFITNHHRNRAGCDSRESSRWYNQRRWCYRRACKATRVCQNRVRDCERIMVGPNMAVLQLPSYSWDTTWRDFMGALCVIIGHMPGIDAVRGSGDDWRRGSRAVRVVDLWLESMGRQPVCCYSFSWRQRLIAYLETPEGFYHFGVWRRGHLERNPRPATPESPRPLEGSEDSSSSEAADVPGA